MAGFESIHDDDEDVIASINIVPFVDIVLVLLVIFMVTSTAIARSALKVELPQAASAGQSVSATANVVLTREGETYLDGVALAQSDLARALAERVANEPELQVVISADKALPYGQVVSVIDLVKLNGVRTFALNIEQKPAPNAG